MTDIDSDNFIDLKKDNSFATYPVTQTKLHKNPKVTGNVRDNRSISAGQDKTNQSSIIRAFCYFSYQ